MTQLNTASPSLALMGGGWKQKKLTIYILRDKEDFNSKSSAWKDKTSRNSFPTSHTQGDVQSSPGKQGSVACTSDLGRQTSSIRITPFPPSSLNFTGWTGHLIAWDTPLISWDQLSQLCPLIISSAPSAFSLMG